MGLDEASLQLGSGEVRAGQDLREVVQDALRLRSLIDGLHSRYKPQCRRTGGSRWRAQP